MSHPNPLCHHTGENLDANAKNLARSVLAWQPLFGDPINFVAKNFGASALYSYFRCNYLIFTAIIWSQCTWWCGVDSMGGGQARRSSRTPVRACHTRRNAPRHGNPDTFGIYRVLAPCVANRARGAGPFFIRYSIHAALLGLAGQLLCIPMFTYRFVTCPPRDSEQKLPPRKFHYGDSLYWHR
jgi:hypothetical protein